MNLTELLDRAAGLWPEKPALIEGGTAVSYASVVDQVSTLAAELIKLQLPPGCRIGLYFPNSITYVALTFALWKCNAVVVPIPMECTEEEVRSLAKAMRLGGILTQRSAMKGVAIAANCFFHELSPELPPDNHGLNIAFIRFTSGTTSARKGVVLCHETVRDRIRAANHALRITSNDTVLWCLPMSHHFLATIVLYLSHGATIVLARHTFARPFLEAANRWQATVLYAAPFHYGLLARDDSGTPLSSVRLAVSTTCRLPQETAVAFRQRFGLPLSQALGVIELGLICVNVDDPISRWDSVGRPQPDFAVRIDKPDENGFGEVMVAGAGLFDAYDCPWTPREELMPDGWFATGDIGRIDTEGFIFVVSRKNAVINLGGRKVFPEEIEAVLNRHPDVRESRVYGVPHPRLGETVEAEVALRDAATESHSLSEYCRRHLSSDKIPSRIHFVSGIARTAVNGKIRRQAALPVS
jgi:long-chain acyl-CoA synthetase